VLDADFTLNVVMFLMGFKNDNICIYRPVEVVTLKQPHVVQELTSVLREWGHIWKHLYIVSTAELFIHSWIMFFWLYILTKVFSS
jgi:hypothetical protein